MRRSPPSARPVGSSVVRTSPTVLVDAAHNPAGMAATVDAIKESFDFTRLVGVVGVRRRQGRRRDPGRARGRLRRDRRHPEQLAAGDAGRRAGRARRRRLRRRPGRASRRGSTTRFEQAIELAEAGPDNALGGSGVLVTGSVITAGEARTLMTRRSA